jgi:hypothetical protein
MKDNTLRSLQATQTLELKLQSLDPEVGKTPKEGPFWDRVTDLASASPSPPFIVCNKIRL